VQLDQLLRAGKKKSDIAIIFRVSPGAITHACKELRAGVCTAVALEAGHKVVQKQLDVVDQLYQSNKRIDEIVEDLMAKIRGEKTGTPDLKGNKEIRLVIKDLEEERRKQLGFQMDVLKTLTNFQSITEFQSAVLNAIAEANKCHSCGEMLVCARCGVEGNLKSVIV
jgi:predicted KAP-like P-loop ATPase